MFIGSEAPVESDLIVQIKCLALPAMNSCAGNWKSTVPVLADARVVNNKGSEACVSKGM